MILRKLFACIVLLFATGLAWAGDKAVYHITDSDVQAAAALRNLRNHLDIDPDATLIVVAHSQGVDFLMEGARDRSGAAYASTVSALKSRGVTFEVCEITLKARGLRRDQFILEADFTPSGVVRLTKLQGQGYAYIRP